MSEQEKNVKHTGSVTMNDIVEIARVMRPRSCAKDLAGTCKEILGTAVSVGCKVDRMDPRDVMAKVSLTAGLYLSWLATVTSTANHQPSEGVFYSINRYMEQVLFRDMHATIISFDV